MILNPFKYLSRFIWTYFEPPRLLGQYHFGKYGTIFFFQQERGDSISWTFFFAGQSVLGSLNTAREDVTGSVVWGRFEMFCTRNAFPCKH